MQRHRPQRRANARLRSSARRFLSQAEAAVKDNNLLCGIVGGKSETLADGLKIISTADSDSRKDARRNDPKN